MERRRLGNSEIMVSPVCLGCMGFGEPESGMHKWTLGEDEAREIIKRALELGVNFFDTAIAYQGGSSERFVGRALRDFARREDVVVATKFPPRTDLSISAAEYINTMLETSLRNLGMEYVDLYILHAWDNNTPICEIMAALDGAVRSGKVRAIGISNCFAWQLAKANALAEKEGFAKFVSVQGHYNLIFREEEREMSPLCRADNIAMTPYSALAAGRLARLPGETSKRGELDAYAKGKYDATAEADNVIINRVAEIAGRRGVSMTEVSLSWLMSKTTSPVAGATKLSHIEGAVKAAELKLTEDEMKYLEEPYVPHRLVGMMAAHN